MKSVNRKKLSMDKSTENVKRQVYCLEEKNA